MTTILCIHLILSGLGVCSSSTERLFILEVYMIPELSWGFRKITNLALNPGVIFGYLLKFPFGGEAWIVSVDN
jgi:photosystem II CP43 chlorophyll apoprotein